MRPAVLVVAARNEALKSIARETLIVKAIGGGANVKPTFCHQTPPAPEIREARRLHRTNHGGREATRRSGEGKNEESLNEDIQLRFGKGARAGHVSPAYDTDFQGLALGLRSYGTGYRHRSCCQLSLVDAAPLQN
jgi:hypothetical protein